MERNNTNAVQIKTGMNLKESVGLEENLEGNQATTRSTFACMGVTDSVGGGLSDLLLDMKTCKLATGPWQNLIYS